jgi:hypothetical protein
VNCGSSDCGLDATVWASWPGKGLAFCPWCLQRAQRVAAAMGFELDTRPIEDSLAFHRSARSAADRLNPPMRGRPEDGE